MRTAIFDLDGTLADTAGDLVTAANAALASVGATARLDAGPDRATALRGGRAMLRLGLVRDRGEADEALVDVLYPRLLEFYADAIDRETRLYDGAVDALEALGAAGWRLGVCTNKPQGLADTLLVRLGIATHFGAILGADALPVRKPDPRHLTETIARAGGITGRAVLVGDTATDRDTARAAGVPCVLVGFGPEGAAIARLAPEAILHHFEELSGLLEGLVPPDAPAIGSEGPQKPKAGAAETVP